MASERSASSNNLDECLAIVRDKSLIQGEKIITQAMGDHGQAIVLTDSRVFVLKTGITATGSLNGEKATIFTFDEISCIKLRRGPMGAVIQVISTQASNDSQTIPPDNILIFNGDDKVKKCEAIAVKMGNMGLNIERIGFESENVQSQTPKIKKPRAKKIKATDINETIVQTDDITANVQSEEPAVNTIEETVPENISSTDEIKPHRTPTRKKVQRSLAEEMYAEITGADAEPINTIQPIKQEEKYEEIVQVESTENVPVIVPTNEPINSIETDFDLEPFEEQAIVKEPVVSQTIIEEISSVEAKIEIPISAEVNKTAHIEELTDEAAHLHLESFRPNPRLPKPVSKVKSNKNQMFVLLVLLAIVFVGGVAYLKPISKPVKTNEVTINLDELTLSPKAIRKQLEDIDNYKKEARKIVKASNDASRGFLAAIKSNSKTAQYDEALDKAWRDIDALSAPSGLASVKQNLTKVLFDRKTAVANAEAGFNDNISQTTNTLAKIDKTIEQNFSAIDEACAKLEKRFKQSEKKNKD